jgi:hypothetical protein
MSKMEGQIRNCTLQKNELLYDKEMMSLYRGNAQIWGSAGPYLHTDRNRDGPRLAQRSFWGRQSSGGRPPNALLDGNW